jgi:hypothetical protein
MSVYNSQRDSWIVALIWLGVLTLCGAMIQVWQQGPPFLLFKLGFVTLSLLASSVLLWALYGTWYDLTDTELRVHSGPLRWRIPISSIQSVHRTYNPLSSPACSLNRLHIHHREHRWGLLISPDRQAEFLDELAAMDPDLIRSGDRLDRRGRASEGDGRGSEATI